VGAAGKVFFATQPGRAACVSAADGRQLWSVSLVTSTNSAAAEETFDAPLLLASNALVLASTLGNVYSLDAATGRSNWIYRAGARIQGAPAFSPSAGGGSVIVLTQPNGALHSADLATGKPLWKAADTIRADGSPAVADGRVAFGNCDASLHAFSAADGGKLQSVPLGPDSQVAGGVAMDGNLAFSGSRSGMIVCADLAGGKIIWSSREAGGEVFTTPAVNDKVVVVGAGSGVVLCLDRAGGALKWKMPLPGAASSPVIAGSKVVVSAGGALHILNLADGAPGWSQKIGDDITPPAVVQGRIVVGGQDGYVTAFGAKEEDQPPKTPKDAK
jgi:outer membrane protein assembly factor BamB